MRKKNRRQFTLSTKAEEIVDDQRNASKFVDEAIIEKASKNMTEYHDLWLASQSITERLRKLTDLNEEKI